MANGWEVTPRAEVEALFIYNEIFKQSCYLKHGIVIKDGAVVVDVGANVGQLLLPSLLFVYFSIFHPDSSSFLQHSMCRCQISLNAILARACWKALGLGLLLQPAANGRWSLKHIYAYECSHTVVRHDLCSHIPLCFYGVRACVQPSTDIRCLFCRNWHT